MYKDIRKATQARELLKIASALLREADPEGLMPSSKQVDDAADDLAMDVVYAQEHARG